jgi:hypothetical protein
MDFAYARGGEPPVCREYLRTGKSEVRRHEIGIKAHQLRERLCRPRSIANLSFLHFPLKSVEHSDNRGDNTRHAECDSLSKSENILQIGAFAMEYMLRLAVSAFSVWD